VYAHGFVGACGGLQQASGPSGEEPPQPRCPGLGITPVRAPSCLRVNMALPRLACLILLALRGADAWTRPSPISQGAITWLYYKVGMIAPSRSPIIMFSPEPVCLRGDSGGGMDVSVFEETQ
jgi:hypothetical protein